MLNFFNSKRSVKILLFFWIISAIYCYFFLPPKNDDGIYMSIALSVINNGVPGILINNEIIPTFFIFPTQPFLNGIFLKIIGLIGFDLNEYNYRLLNIILFVTLIIITSNLINYLLKKNKLRHLLNSTFLILISLTPFANNFYVNRPEIIGLLLIITTIYYISSAIRKRENGYLFYIKVGALLGITSTIHPNFSILSISIYTIFLFQKFQHENLKKIFTSLLSLGISISPFIIWMLINYEYVSDQLFNRISHDFINEGNNSLGLTEIFKLSLFLGNESLPQKIYNFFFNFPLMAIIIASIIFNIVLLFKYKLNYFFKNYNFCIFFVSIIIFLTMLPYAGYISLVSFLLSFNVIISLTKISDLKFIKKRFNFFISIIFIFGLISPLNPIFFHKIKNMITDNQYFEVDKTRKIISDISNVNSIFILTTPKFLPLFSNKIEQQIKKNNVENLYWFFPVVNRPSKNFIEMYHKDFDAATKNDISNLIWVIEKNNYKNNCLILVHNSFVIRLGEVEKLYENKRYLFLKTNSLLKFQNMKKCYEKRII